MTLLGSCRQKVAQGEAIGLESSLHHGHILHLPQAPSLLGLQLCVCPRATAPTLLLPLEKNSLMLRLSVPILPPQQVIDEPRGCTGPVFSAYLGCSSVEGPHSPLLGISRYWLGIPAADGSVQSHVPRRHGPGIKQCSGPRRAVCPRAPSNRWASRRAREVSSSARYGGMCAKTHRPLLVPLPLTSRDR